MQFEPLKEVTDFIQDTNRLTSSLKEDGYLFFRNFLDTEKILEAKNDMMEVLCKHGIMEKNGNSEPIWKGVKPDKDTHQTVYTKISHLNSLEAITENKQIIGIYERLFGGPVHIYPMPLPRFFPPDPYPNFRIGWHQDCFPWPDSTDLHTVWIPFMDMDESIGGLVMVKGSHIPDFTMNIYDYDPAKGVPGINGGKLTDMTKLRSDYQLGDLLIFGGKMIHRGLPNRSNELRFSMDCRYQPKNAPMDWKASFHDDDNKFYMEKVVRPAVAEAGLTGENAERATWEIALANPVKDRIAEYVKNKN